MPEQQIRFVFWAAKPEFWFWALDILKGVTASSLVLFLGSIVHGTDRYINIQLLFGLCAVLGHLFPIYENFKGGKGIATLLGMVIGINYALAIAVVALFLVVLFFNTICFA
jgi:glycerol-3-phosphate acyltransferase PlsY